MSEEKPGLPDEPVADTATQTKESAAATAPKSGGQVVVVIGLFIAAVLTVVVLLGKQPPGRPASAEEVEIGRLKDQASALERELSLRSSGDGSLDSGLEPIGEIANRVRTDAASLVTMAERFQELLSAKDGEMAAKNRELLRSEQQLQMLLVENERLRGEIGRGKAAAAEAEGLEAELATSKARRDLLAAELAKVREQAEKGSGEIADQLDDLKRQLEETTRAKDFFEKRVKELGGSAENP